MALDHQTVEYLKLAREADAKAELITDEVLKTEWKTAARDYRAMARASLINAGWKGPEDLTEPLPPAEADPK